MHHFFSAIVLLLISSTVIAADGRDDIVAAMSKHESTVSALGQKMDNAFLDAIKMAANAEQLAQLRTLLDERDEFMELTVLSKSPAMAEAVETYTSARKESALDVVAAYRATMEDFAKLLLLNEAQSIKHEMNDFINSERVDIGLKPDLSLTEKSNVADETNDDSQSQATAKFLEKLIADMMLELELITKLETSAIRENAHRKLMKRIDNELKRHRLVFHFPIDDVELSGRNSYHLDLGTPTELKNIRYKSRLGGIPQVRLKSSKALSLGAGHAYRIRGQGRLSFDVYDLPNVARAVRIFVFDSPYLGYKYGVYVWDYKTDISAFDTSYFSTEEKSPPEKILPAVPITSKEAPLERRPGE